jgi:hypothetical protein
VKTFQRELNKTEEGILMTSWELIFLQSRVNDGAYDGDHLPAQNWEWPRGTWFQERLYYLRAGRREIAEKHSQAQEIVSEAPAPCGGNIHVEYGLSCVNVSDLLDPCNQA